MMIGKIISEDGDKFIVQTKSGVHSYLKSRFKYDAAVGDSVQLNHGENGIEIMPAGSPSVEAARSGIPAGKGLAGFVLAILGWIFGLITLAVAYITSKNTSEDDPSDKFADAGWRIALTRE